MTPVVSPAPRSERPWLTIAMIALSLAALLLPPLLIETPPVTDYTNHLARLWLIAGGAQDPALAPYYAVAWSRTVTNIAVDLVAAGIGPWLGVERLGPILLALSIALPPLGAVVLNRRLFGGWHWWQVLFAAFGWTLTAVLGFLNFQLGLGVALLAAAADPFLQRRGLAWAIVGRLAFGALLTVFHPFAVLFYAALIGGLALGPRPPWRDAPALMRRVMVATASALPVVAPLALAVATAPVAPGAGADGLPWVQWGDMGLGRVDVLMTAFTTYGPLFDLPVLFVLIVVLVLAVNRRLLVRHGGLLAVALTLVALALVMPMKLGDTFYIDRRLPIMALLTFAAATRPALWSGRQAAVAAAAVMLAVSLTRTASIAGVWIARQPDADAVRRVLASVEPGSAVLPLMHTPTDAVVARLPAGRYVRDPTFWHYATLAVSERRAFVSTLFTAAGKQPVVVRPAWAAAASPNAPVITVHALTLAPERLPPIAAHIRQWHRFNYVLVLGADTPDGNGPLPAVPGLSLAADEGFARLYRVEPEPR